MHNIHVKLNDNGATVIFHPNSKMPDFNKLGQVTDDRPGLQVLPIATWKRFAFKLLRKVFGRKGKVANWTRTWKGWGLWTQEGEQVKNLYIAGYVSFVYHSTAVEWEVQYLKALNC